jgi:hypothetical protein
MDEQASRGTKIPLEIYCSLFGGNACMHLRSAFTVPY